MSLMHPALLFGLGLALVPVVLHLLMRARPKVLVFPALRLLQQRRRQNQRRLRLRHWWLLLLRMALIAGLVLAIARPSLPPANYTPSVRELVGLVGILAAALAVYSGVMWAWRRGRVSPLALSQRRTYLRGGVGLLTLAGLLLLVAWPYQRRVAAEITTPSAAALQNLPVAAIFVCDTSLSLGYQYEGRSRLEVAREIAISHLSRLPAGSTAAVLDAAGDLPPVHSPDLTAVRNRLEALALSPRAAPLNEALRQAIRHHEDERRRTLGAEGGVDESRAQDKFVREIYLLTDLAKSAWRDDEAQTLKTELAEREWLGLYLIDVGVEQPTNQGVVELRAARETVGAGGTVALEATVRAQGVASPTAIVELWQGTDAGPLAKRDQQSVSLTEGTAARVRFQVDVAAESLAQGSLRLLGADPLKIDDEAHFTIKVLRPLRVLVVASQRKLADYWLRALSELAGAGNPCETTFVAADRLATQSLESFDIVCWLNVGRPTEVEWRALGEFTERGGGALIVLGAPSSAASAGRETIDPVAYGLPAAAAVLPATPKASLKFPQPRRLNFRASAHPLTTRLETLGVLAGLAEVPFRRYWSVDPRPETAILARWTEESAPPGLLLRDVGRGRALLFTSNVDSVAWSDWPADWTYLALADQWLQLLSRQARVPHTWLLGDPVVMPISAPTSLTEVMLRQPDLTQRRAEITATQELVLSDLTSVGHYQVVTPGAGPKLVTGFSVNLPPRETDLTRLSTADLDTLLGPGRYGLARDPDSLTRSVQSGRLGQEVAGLLLGLLAIIFLLEQAAATWFYRQDEVAPGAAPA